LAAHWALTYVYDEHGRTDAVLEEQGLRTERWLDGLHSSTVTVAFGSVICTYDENGQTLYARAA
jgi:hypothetical protein